MRNTQWIFTGSRGLAAGIRCFWGALVGFLLTSDLLHASPGFHGKIMPIPTTIQTQMKHYTWQPNCPVPLADLRYLTLSYWGFDHKPHQGELIVNKVLAKEVLNLFNALYQHKFPIQQMQLMDVYHGDDEASMAANNTSAFNCRAVTGHPTLFSQHSYGRAIDINPLINPYVGKSATSPKAGLAFVDRSKALPGKITKESFIYKLFVQKGWDWGGHWIDVQDYQHFEKRANGEKRNPYGYKY